MPLFRLLAVLGAAVVLIALLIVISGLVVYDVRQIAFEPRLEWPTVRPAPEQPLLVAARARLDGLTEIALPVAAPVNAAAVSATLYDARGQVIAEATPSLEHRAGWDYLVFSVPRQTESAGDAFTLSISPNAGATVPAPEFVEAPGRFYPDGLPGAERQLAFDLGYQATLRSTVLNLAESLGGTSAERWASSAAIFLLGGLAVCLAAALLGLTWWAQESPTT